MEIIDPDILVNKIIALWDAGIKDDATVIEKIQSEFQISENEAETVLELTQTGLFRAQIMSNGQGQKYPKSNLTKNPIVISALKIGLTQLGRPDLCNGYYAVCDRLIMRHVDHPKLYM